MCIWYENSSCYSGIRAFVWWVTAPGSFSPVRATRRRAEAVVVTLAMATSLRGRAARLLETLASQSSASRSVAYVGNAAKGSELGCDAAPPLTFKTVSSDRRGGSEIL